MNKLVQWLITITAGVVFFVIFLFWSFPYNLVVQHYLAQIEKQTKGAYRITVGDMEPSVLFKSKFKNIQFHQMGRGGEDKVLVDFSELKIGISYISLLADHLKGSFVAKGRKGTMEGSLFIAASEKRLDIKLDGFELAGLPVLLHAFPLDLKPDGKISGTLKFGMESDDFSKSEGDINLKFESLRTAAGHVGSGPMFSMDLPDVEFSSAKQFAVLQGTIQKGKLNLKTLSTSGEDVTLTATGTIQLAKRWDQSSVSATGTFKLSDHLKESLGILVPMIEKQKKEDSSYPLELSGKLGEPGLKIGTLDLAGFKDVPSEAASEPAPEAGQPPSAPAALPAAPSAVPAAAPARLPPPPAANPVPAAPSLPPATPADNDREP